MKIFTTILATLFSALFIWIGTSWVDIILDNSAENPTHSNINFFVLLCEWGEEIHGVDLYE